MVSFERADKSQAHLPSKIAGLPCIESHVRPDKPEDINYFIQQKYNPETFTAELTNSQNNYFSLLSKSPGRIFQYYLQLSLRR